MGTVIETVEGSLGVPDPDTLAKEALLRKEEWKKIEEESKEKQSNEHKTQGIKIIKLNTISQFLITNKYLLKP